MFGSDRKRRRAKTLIQEIIDDAKLVGGYEASECFGEVYVSVKENIEANREELMEILETLE